MQQVNFFFEANVPSLGVQHGKQPKLGADLCDSPGCFPIGFAVKVQIDENHCPDNVNLRANLNY